MNLELKILFDRVSTDRLKLLQEVALLSNEKFTSCPQAGKWSISEILTHVLTSEKLSLGYMLKKSNRINELNDSGPWESLKMMLLKMSQRLPLKFKAPKVVVDHTPEALSKGALTNAWHQHLNELQTFLETIEDKNIRKKIYKHPFAGRLDARQALQFFQEHFHHHLPQVRKLLS